MKICTKCKIEKSLDDFGKKYDKKQSHCKECGKIYVRNHYSKNKEYYYEKNKKRKIELQKWVFEFLKTKSCCECGESETIMLDFDHRNPKNKSFSISKGILNRKSLKTLQKEIAKCDIRCVKCHRRRTAKQFGWFRS